MYCFAYANISLIRTAWRSDGDKGVWIYNGGLLYIIPGPIIIITILAHAGDYSLLSLSFLQDFSLGVDKYQKLKEVIDSDCPKEFMELAFLSCRVRKNNVHTSPRKPPPHTHTHTHTTKLNTGNNPWNTQIAHCTLHPTHQETNTSMFSAVNSS